ncbi:MAG: hypothetical protein FJW38_16010 [Acidobacteria bacterium]|nr:hypothetical protein [Acidobacteriota bacterium]
MPVAVETYLSTRYEPACDFVDGELVERAAGYRDHSAMIGALLNWFHANRRKALCVLRLQITLSRYRVVDICVDGPHAPYICIEVLSPEEDQAVLREKLADYARIDAANIWVIDPAERNGACYENGALGDATPLLRTTDGRVELPIAELFTIDD